MPQYYTIGIATRSSKVDNFYVISKGLRDFLLLIDSNLKPYPLQFLRYGDLQVEKKHIFLTSCFFGVLYLIMSLLH